MERSELSKNSFADDWRTRLKLEPHPEGGWFRRIYTAEAEISTPRGSRPLASSIHYLLDATRPRGRFHRVRSTILHFLQSGGPVEYALIGPDGGFCTVTLGFDAVWEIVLEAPGGTWKASRLVGDASHALVSEVVLPGFAWEDHDYLTPEALAAWPAGVHGELARRGWSVE